MSASMFSKSLCCLSFFDLWILTALLVSSNSSCYLLVSTLKSNIGTAMIIILKSQRIFMKYLCVFNENDNGDTPVPFICNTTVQRVCGRLNI
jgi:hypothetical protein